MIEAAFISDLHLHPKDAELYQRFQCFLEWAKHQTQAVYILGDFFHVYAGDDLMDTFHHQVANDLKQLSLAGVDVFLMSGNRDFLLAETFASTAGLTLIPDSSVICLTGIRIYLTHGDKYCLHDWPHQCLRLLTRPKLCRLALLNLSKKWRLKLVQEVRSYSQQKTKPTNARRFQISTSALYQDMRKWMVHTVIYGHVHQQAIYEEQFKLLPYQRYVLADWDHLPQILCYTQARGLFFHQIHAQDA